MNAEHRMQIEHSCRDLVNRLTQLSDRQQKSECSELFTPDGIWIRGGTPHRGRAAIVGSFAGSPTQIIRHLATGTVIDVEDEYNARGVTYYIVYRHDPKSDDAKPPFPLEKPFSMGEWHDRFVKTESGWRFAEREVRRLFQG